MSSVPGWRGARFHLVAIALLYTLTVPVAIIDHRTLGGGGGGWISLDLRGLYVAGYLIAAGLVATTVLLHLSVKKLGKRFSFGLVVACLFLPACLVPIGSSIYQSCLRAAARAKARQVASVANTLADSISVRWSVSAGVIPTRFDLELTSRIPVDVLHVSVTGSAASQHGTFCFSSTDEEPLVFRLEAGVPRRVSRRLDHEPTPDTYWQIYTSLRADGTTVTVGWLDPSSDDFGGDAVRRIPLH
jgi:hypothetical protein